MTTFTVPADTLLATVAKTTQKGKDSIWSFYLRTRSDKATVYFAESDDAKRINVETIEELRNLYRNFVNAYGYEMITLKK